MDNAKEEIAGPKKSASLEEVAAMYLRTQLDCKCPRCGDAIKFVRQNGAYTSEIAAVCLTCDIRSRQYKYSTYIASPVALANGAMKDAVMDCKRMAVDK